MDKNKKEKLIPVVVRVSQENKNKIKELAEKQGKTEADIIREGIERIININMYTIKCLKRYYGMQERKQIIILIEMTNQQKILIYLISMI